MFAKLIHTAALVLLSYIADAQINFIGKIYKAQISASCKLMNDGGCIIYTYRVLTFSKDSVLVSYR